jgi:glycosyltransferase involved in cell wall biosynthesis
MLAEHYRRFAALPQFIRDRIEYIVVDDGSPSRLDVLKGTQNDSIEPPWRLFEGCEQSDFKSQGFYIDGPKIPWNYACARNIGVKHASNPYVLVTDIDHAVPETTLFALLRWLSGDDDAVQTANRALSYGRPADNRVFKFSHRIKAATGERYKKHPDTILCTKRFWTDVLGYHDEKYRGGYGGDGEHWARIKSLATDIELDLPLILFGREAIPDASTPRKEFEPGCNPGEQGTRNNAAIRAMCKLTFGSTYHRVW